MPVFWNVEHNYDLFAMLWLHKLFFTLIDIGLLCYENYLMIVVSL